MRLLAAIIVLVWLATPALAQDAGAPVIETNIDKTDTIPGQTLNLSVTVLVPTYMPKPPVWPSYEAPNLLVRLPGQATNPTSKRIDDETWSGITRTYSISPMVPGRFTLPAQDVIITYADPETNKPVQTRLMTNSLTITGVIPKGAEALDPFIAADDLKLSQEIDGNPEKMVPGDSVVRTVTAIVTGTSPMFLPKLMPEVAIEGIAAYPDEPSVEEHEERGVASGKRVERVTLMAEGGGSGTLPPVSLHWYDIGSGKVETAMVEGLAIHVDGPPAHSGEPRDWRLITVAGLAVFVVISMAYWLVRWLLPIVAGWLCSGRQTWIASERHAFAELQRSVRRQNLSATLTAIDLWAQRLAGPDPCADPRVQEKLTAIGRARYGNGPAATASDGWRTLPGVLKDIRRRARSTPQDGCRLKPLNPV